MTIITVFSGFLPGLFWLYYFYKKDEIEPEPKSLVFKAYLIGILAAIPIIIAELRLSTISEFLPEAIIIAPFVEELGKLLAVYLFIYHNREFDEPMDGIVYAASLALGFASIENVGYLYNAGRQGNITEVFHLRALLSVPGHALFASFWGYGLGLIKFQRITRLIFTLMVMGAILAHGLFNLAVSFSFETGAGVVIVVAALWIGFQKVTRHALAISPHREFSKYSKLSESQNEE